MNVTLLQLKKVLHAALFVLLLSVVGMAKGYAYNVTIASASNGTVAANPTTANAGEVVTLTATPQSMYGFALENWIVTDVNNDTINVTQDGDNPNLATFTMPDSDVTVSASFFRSFLLFAIFEDYQACEELVPKREKNGDLYLDYVESLQLPHYEELWTKPWYYGGAMSRTDGYIFLAQNEKEGFQVFFREQEKERNLRIEVSPFLNSQGEELQHSVYWEEYFWADNVVSVPDSLAEALVPYSGEPHKTSVGHNKVFFIELESTKNQTPSSNSDYYTSTITAYDGDDVLATRTIHAKVWNFALPENHYSEVVMGLYNRNSSYGGTSSLFKLNGINVDGDGNVADSDLPFAKQVLDGYQECLLEHGVSTFEIPRWKMADDPKAAELTMADPRRKVFVVPVHWFDVNGSSFKPDAQAVITQYKDIIYDNVFLKDKAFFYPMDEPDWTIEGDVTQFNAVCNAMLEIWPGYHAVIPFNDNYCQTNEMFNGKTDIFCPNQALLDPWKAENVNHPELYAVEYSLKQPLFEDYTDRANHPDRFRTWRYQGDGQSGGTQFWIPSLAVSGMMRRIVFWQQYRMNSDGWLYWNCAFLPDDWVKKRLPASTGIQTGNGDGVLLYPGTLFGQSAETPVVSLRLKQLSAGIDDYDYLRLAEEFLTEEEINSIINTTYIDDHTLDCGMLNRQNGYYTGYTSIHLQKARYDLGQLLSAANTEHEWSEWRTAVFPDETHNGLEIRTCSHCGAQESREKIYQISTQEIALISGWNWFSTYLDIEKEDLKNALNAALPTATSITIKSKEGNSRYNGTRWRETNFNWDVASMYKIEVPEACVLTLTGLAINPADHPITIAPNTSTWIGFPFSESMTLDQAFPNGFAVSGDVIKGKDGNARYTGTQWRAIGINSLEPGKGYMYIPASTVTEDRILIYPTNAK